MTINKEKKDLDWANIGFEYTKTELRFTATYENGKWSEGELVEDNIMHVHEGAPALHYAQQCFEGMKAQTAKDGRVLLFRPDLNAARMQTTAERLLMPQVPTELFMEGVKEAVKANYSWIPPYGSGAALYVRPFYVGVGDNLGLRTAKRFDFRVFVSPVGPYYKGEGLSTIKLAVTDVDRAAPQGTGSYKAGANYAGGLLATQKAKELGGNEALYLDSATRQYIDEAGSANIIVAMSGNRLVTPKSDAILPSVTRRSVMVLAEKELGMKVEDRPIHLSNEIAEFEEVGACGTAAVISPVGQIYVDGQWHKFHDNGETVGPTIQKLYDTLTGIQVGTIEDSYGWTVEVKV